MLDRQTFTWVNPVFGPTHRPTICGLCVMEEVSLVRDEVEQLVSLPVGEAAECFVGGDSCVAEDTVGFDLSDLGE